MSDFLNKVITLIIVLVMVIIGPLTFSYVSNESSAKRLIINEVEQFLDEVKDKGAVDMDNLNELYEKLNSHGMNLDVKVTKLKRVVEYDSLYNKIKENYLLCDESTAYDEMMWDKGTESAVSEYKLKYNIDGTSTQDVIKQLKEIKSKKYEFCLEKFDIVRVEVNEITFSSTKRILHKVTGISENKLKISMETMIR